MWPWQALPLQQLFQGADILKMQANFRVCGCHKQPAMGMRMQIAAMQPSQFTSMPMRLGRKMLGPRGDEDHPVVEFAHIPRGQGRMVHPGLGTERLLVQYFSGQLSRQLFRKFSVNLFRWEAVFPRRRPVRNGLGSSVRIHMQTAGAVRLADKMGTELRQGG